MSQSSTDARPNIFPTFRYQDAHAATAWLAEAFGFQQQLLVPAENGGVAHAQLNLGAGAILLGSMHEEPGNPWGTERQGVYVSIDDVDGHYARAKSGGAKIVRELQDTPYGSREYSARDLEGNLWCFGSYRPELTGQTSGGSK